MRIKSLIQLFRLDLSLAAGICVLAGQIIALGTLPSLNLMIMGFGVGFFISSSTLILNDYFDMETDKINAPHRPLPSGMIEPSTIIFLSIITTLAGLITAYFINNRALVVAVIFYLVGFLYNWKLKRTGLLGNLMVSSSVAITFIFGAIVVGNPWNKLVWIFSSIAFFIDLGEEITFDALDMEGDKKINSQSIALNYNPTTALTISSFIFSAVIVISLIPLILGGVGISYWAMVIIMNLVIIFSIFKILKSQKTQEKRIYARWIYGGAIIGLLIFLSGQIIGI